MAKKYIWLKLKEDFFQQKPIKKLRKMAGGATFTLIYLKMQLLSLKSEGKLYFDNVEENFAEEIALELDETVDDVKMTLLFLEKNNLIEVGDLPDEYILPQVMDCIGSETAAAERKRKQRLREKLLIEQKSNITAIGCDIVTPSSQPVTKGHIEKEIEKDKEIDIEREENLSQKYPFLEKIKKLRKIIIKSTGCTEYELDMIFKPIHYKENIDNLLIEIGKSNYLQGLANAKPNLNTFTVNSQINRILAGAYRNNEKTVKQKFRVEDIEYPDDPPELLKILEEEL